MTGFCESSVVTSEDIEAIERATLAAVTPEALEEIAGWLLPFDSGTVGRARSAVPLAHTTPDPPSLHEIEARYAARGLPRGEALAMARKLIADPARALDTLAREELGLNPDELGSPWGAALSSFLAFAAGALVPLASFLLLKGQSALYTSIGVTAGALFGIGAVISLFTGRSAWRDGLRMLLIGAAAGALTFFIGRWLGVNLA